MAESIKAEANNNSPVVWLCKEMRRKFGPVCVKTLHLYTFILYIYSSTLTPSELCKFDAIILTILTSGELLALYFGSF